jgi:hypothetical protein
MPAAEARTGGTLARRTWLSYALTRPSPCSGSWSRCTSKWSPMACRSRGRARARPARRTQSRMTEVAAAHRQSGSHARPRVSSSAVCVYVDGSDGGGDSTEMSKTDVRSSVLLSSSSRLGSSGAITSRILHIFSVPRSRSRGVAHSPTHEGSNTSSAAAPSRARSTRAAAVRFRKTRRSGTRDRTRSRSIYVT